MFVKQILYAGSIPNFHGIADIVYLQQGIIIQVLLGQYRMAEVKGCKVAATPHLRIDRLVYDFYAFAVCVYLRLQILGFVLSICRPLYKRDCLPVRYAVYAADYVIVCVNEVYRGETGVYRFCNVRHFLLLKK
jgi:hypothetical protein